jgi:hypothetical protein
MENKLLNNVSYKLCQKNNPFAVGVLSFFVLEYASISEKIKAESLTIGDREECDISLIHLDIERNPYRDAKLFFSNCEPEKQLKENQYVLPFLSNSRYVPLFRIRNKKKKKYKCVAIHRTLHCPGNLREAINPYVIDLCDLAIIDYKTVKTRYKEDEKLDNYWDYFDILDQSEFVIVPPGAQYDTCRYNEALCCNCIPLQMHLDGMCQFIKHPEEYEWDYELLKNGFILPKFREDVLLYLQKNIDEDYLAKRMSEAINKHI